MVKKEKINVKERFTDGEIDLSMSDLVEVPVKEITALKKTVFLDLSNNRINQLPITFSTLTFLLKLDLSKNELTELPEDFGSLSKLKYLDLYRNNIARLPLSFSKLTALRFLDLKDNPLVPTIAKVAGDCADTKGCQQCARDIVKFYQQLEQEMNDKAQLDKEGQFKSVQQQKKQLEKKKKNKKNKIIKKTNTISSTSELAEPIIKETTVMKKLKKNKKLTDQKSNSRSFCYIKISLWLIFALWFSFAINESLMELVGSKISNCYNDLVRKLPENYQIYGTAFGDFVFLMQQWTKDVFLRFYHCIHSNGYIRDLIIKIKSYLNIR